MTAAVTVPVPTVVVLAVVVQAAVQRRRPPMSATEFAAMELLMHEPPEGVVFTENGRGGWRCLEVADAEAGAYYLPGSAANAAVSQRQPRTEADAPWGDTYASDTEPGPDGLCS